MKLNKYTALYFTEIAWIVFQIDDYTLIFVFQVFNWLLLVSDLVLAELAILAVYGLFVTVCVFFNWLDYILCVNCVDSSLVCGLSLCCTVTPLQLTLDSENLQKCH